MQKIIEKLDNTKATGLDDFGVKGSPILSYYLTHIFNLSLNTGSVPSSWKKKRIINQYLKKETLKM